MYRTTPRSRTLAVSGLAVVALAGTGAAVANAATPTASTSPSTTASAPAAPKAHQAHQAHKARAALHSESVRRAKGGTFVTVGTQRGVVTAVTPTSLTARSADGFSRTYVLGADTKVRVDKQPAGVAGLKVGEKVGVTALETGDTWTAKRAIARS